MIETHNAKITSTMLGNEDHGIPTCMLHLEWPSSGQGFGGYDLRYYGINMLLKIMSTVGVSKWEDLPGTMVRIKGDRMKIHSIGHIMEDKWYTPEEDKK